MRRLVFYKMIFILFFSFPGIAFSQELTADEIAYKVYNRDDGKTSFWKEAKMLLIAKDGSQIVRRFNNIAKDDEEGLTKRLIRFLSPADIEGVGFLSLETKDDEDIQYLYLPEVGRPRRISGQNKTNSFVNSDFTFEDLQRRKPNEDLHNLLRVEKKSEYDCYVLAYLPKKSYQYSKLIYWIDKISFIPIYIECYSKKGELTKIFEVKQLKEVSGIWTPLDVVMSDLKRAHKTRLIYNEQKIEYNIPIEDGKFTKENLSSD